MYAEETQVIIRYGKSSIEISFKARNTEPPHTEAKHVIHVTKGLAIQYKNPLWRVSKGLRRKYNRFPSDMIILSPKQKAT